MLPICVSLQKFHYFPIFKRYLAKTFHLFVSLTFSAFMEKTARELAVIECSLKRFILCTTQGKIMNKVPNDLLHIYFNTRRITGDSHVYFQFSFFITETEHEPR